MSPFKPLARVGGREMPELVKLSIDLAQMWHNATHARRDMAYRGGDKAGGDEVDVVSHQVDKSPPHASESVEAGVADDFNEDDGMFEEIAGEIMQAEDGTFYLATDPAHGDIDMDMVSKIEIVLNPDGTETVIFEADAAPVNDSQIMLEADEGKMATSMHSNTSINNADDEDMTGIYLQYQDESKGRRNRVHGQAECPECGQTFVNTARLERHLSVHQVFGQFLCQLCGKTYKYEYNLFYHWRKTCRDLAEMMDQDERKSIEVNALRELVEDIASKKQGLVMNDFGGNAQPLFRTLGFDSLDESRKSMYGKRGVMCKACGVSVLAAHLPKHLNVHRGVDKADEKSVGGGYFCDLCGLIFRHYDNLYKHWRTNCPEIQANLPDDDDLAMDNETLRHMVEELLKKASIDMADDIAPQRKGLQPQSVFNTDAEKARALDSLTADLNVDLSELPPEEPEDDADDLKGANDDMFNQKWIEQHGIIFADDMPEDLPTRAHDSSDPDVATMAGGGAATSGSGGITMQTMGAQQKWLNSGEMVQCPECFKTFINMSRLEKHMAGYHASTGTHHCSLCGNRFKYDYNLLYHYRRSCPYTKTYIDRDVREQIDSTSLRKVVRNLAQRQPALPAHCAASLNSIMQNDALVHKQMLHGVEGDGKMPVTRIPPHNVQPPRSNLPPGYRCPHCNIIFYGRTAIKLHMRMRHNEEFQPKLDDELLEDVEGTLITEMPHDTLAGSLSMAALGRGGDTMDMYPEPPLLDVQERKNAAAPQRHVILDEQGNDITDRPEVQRLIASGEIEFREGEQIILVDRQEEENVAPSALADDTFGGFGTSQETLDDSFSPSHDMSSRSLATDPAEISVLADEEPHRLRRSARLSRTAK